MAFNVLAELPTQQVDWVNINQSLKHQTNGLIEIFPIPAYGGVSKNHIGLSITNNNQETI